MMQEKDFPSRDGVRGRVMELLLEAAEDTEVIATELGLPAPLVSAELIRLSFLGVVMAIGEASYTHETPRSGYDRNFIWSLTDHGRFHNELETGCKACELRERLLLMVMPERWTDSSPPNV